MMTCRRRGVQAGEPERLSWRSVANEFLEEHWQKLLLCLAVLLIVVSSTVGAHLLLGDLLWQPVGKCLLALVATALLPPSGRAWCAGGPSALDG